MRLGPWVFVRGLFPIVFREGVFHGFDIQCVQGVGDIGIPKFVVAEAAAPQLGNSVLLAPALFDNSVSRDDEAGAVGAVPAMHERGLGRGAEQFEHRDQVGFADRSGAHFVPVGGEAFFLKDLGLVVAGAEVDDGFDAGGL